MRQYVPQCPSSCQNGVRPELRAPAAVEKADHECTVFSSVEAARTQYAHNKEVGGSVRARRKKHRLLLSLRSDSIRFRPMLDDSCDLALRILDELYDVAFHTEAVFRHRD